MANNEQTKYASLALFKNWSKTHSCSPSHRVTPRNVPQLRAALAFCAKNGLRATVAGSMLSPSDISMTDDFLIDMRGFNKILSVDPERRTVRVQAGVILKTLIEILRDNYQLAFPSIGSITDQTVGGLLATAVHGTGRSHGSFCSNVTALRLMKADGEILDLRRGSEASAVGSAARFFSAALVGLGCLGVVVDVTLSVDRAFSMHTVQRPVAVDELFESLSAFSMRYEYFRAWLVPYTDKAVVWCGERIDKNKCVGF